MNGNYYKNPTFPTLEENKVMEVEQDRDIKTIKGDILSINIGKKVMLYINNSFLEGVLKEVKDNNIIINDYSGNIWFMVPKVNVIYYKFLENINID